MRTKKFTTSTGVAIIATGIGLFNAVFALSIYESMQIPNQSQHVLGDTSTMPPITQANDTPIVTVTPSSSATPTVNPTGRSGNSGGSGESSGDNIKDFPPLHKIIPSILKPSVTETIEPSHAETIHTSPFPTKPNGTMPSTTPLAGSNGEKGFASLQHIIAQVKNTTGTIDLSIKGTNITIDPSTKSISVKAPDGTVTQLNQNSVAQINQLLEKKNVTIEKNASKFSLTQNGVAASTTLPISIDPTNQSIQVTTNTGTKTISLLPNDAIALLKKQKIIDSVSSSTSSTSAPIQLIQTNNQPTFVINGDLNKKLLGLIPVQIAKQTTISATTGQVQNVTETTLQHILEALSI